MADPIDVFGIIALGLLLVPVSTVVFRGADRAFTRVSLHLFRNDVDRPVRSRGARKRELQSIHSTSTYAAYAAKTISYSAIIALAASLIGIVIAYHVLGFITTTERTILPAAPSFIPSLVQFQLIEDVTVRVFVVLLLSSAVGGISAGAATYHARWWVVRARADQRRVLIEGDLTRTIAFIYALSRSGMVYPQILRTVGRNRGSFGESAEEIGVVVKEMDLFGTGLVNALQRIAGRTPSEQFADFAENFASVLQSGQNVPRYLREQYEHTQSERVANQERLLEMLAAVGEGYVAVLVAGPLFLLTVLLIVGVLTGGLIDLLQFSIYLLIPLANVGFIGYLDSIIEPFSSQHPPSRRVDTSPPMAVRRVNGERSTVRPGRPELDTVPSNDPKLSIDREMNSIRLRAFDRCRRLRSVVENPYAAVISRPTYLLFITVPLGVGAIAFRLWQYEQAGILDVRHADDVIVQTLIFVVATFAIVQEVKTRRLRAIERMVPDLLDRLANTNEAGMTFTQSLRRIERGDLGALNLELERLIADIRWGGRTENALDRFSERIGSASVARVVALLTNAMVASAHLAPVIRIAADEAREDRRLRRRLRQELFLYIVIIYLGFVVFLGVGIALHLVLLPSIPSVAEFEGLAGGSSGVGVSVDLPISPAQPVEKESYSLLLYHAAIVQALCSGFVAGKMGEGRLANGAKHAATLMIFAYVSFLLVS